MLQPNDVAASGLELVRIRTLNEIAFIAGDRAHGGPPREVELAELRHILRVLDERIAAARAPQSWSRESRVEPTGSPIVSGTRLTNE